MQMKCLEWQAFSLNVSSFVCLMVFLCFQSNFCVGWCVCVVAEKNFLLSPFFDLRKPYEQNKNVKVQKMKQ